MIDALIPIKALASKTSSLSSTAHKAPLPCMTLLSPDFASAKGKPVRPRKFIGHAFLHFLQPTDVGEKKLLQGLFSSDPLRFSTLRTNLKKVLFYRTEVAPGSVCFLTPTSQIARVSLRSEGRNTTYLYKYIIL